MLLLLLIMMMSQQYPQAHQQPGLVTINHHCRQLAAYDSITESSNLRNISNLVRLKST